MLFTKMYLKRTQDPPPVQTYSMSFSVGGSGKSVYLHYTIPHIWNSI